jgi:putative nucleotidyltransferase with HDIG domain
MIWFRMGAFLHDVGKMSVPEVILKKAGVLSAEERRVIESHTVLGEALLSNIPFPWDIRPMIRSHHERWDGNGYPDGLIAEEIPITARILRCADVFDALTTQRSYRCPLSAEEAFAIMKADIGAFDPNLLVVFESLLPSFSEMVPTCN